MTTRVMTTKKCNDRIEQERRTSLSITVRRMLQLFSIIDNFSKYDIASGKITQRQPSFLNRFQIFSSHLNLLADLVARDDCFL